MVCEALDRGHQTIILRKGGIHEGRAGFAFDHKEFFLFPTLFHEQEKHLRGSGSTSAEPENQDQAEYCPGDAVAISCWAICAGFESLVLVRTTTPISESNCIVVLVVYPGYPPP